MALRYEHTVHSPQEWMKWFEFVVLVGGLLTVAVASVLGHSPGLRPLVAAVAAALLAASGAVVSYSPMTVTVDDDAVELRTWHGLLRRLWPLDNVRRFRARQTRGFYGLQLRWGPHGWLTDPFDTVELELADDRQVLIASDEPDTLLDAIADAPAERAGGQVEKGPS